MSYEMIVGLQISDEKLYSDYRNAMQPLLMRAGGGFRYDFMVSEVLKNESEQPMNRVFAIYFEDETKMDLFFNDPEYLAIKTAYFEKSVKSTTIISAYNR